MYEFGVLEKGDAGNAWRRAAQRLAAVATVFHRGRSAGCCSRPGTWSFLNPPYTTEDNDLSITCSKYRQTGRCHGQHCHVRNIINQLFEESANLAIVSRPSASPLDPSLYRRS